MDYDNEPGYRDRRLPPSGDMSIAERLGVPACSDYPDPRPSPSRVSGADERPAAHGGNTCSRFTLCTCGGMGGAHCLNCGDPRSAHVEAHRPARVEPPPGAEVAAVVRGLPTEAQAQVLRHAELLAAGPVDREALGREVRAEWVAWAHEQPYPKGSWLTPWEAITEPEREVDRRIGEHLYRMGQAAGDQQLRAAARRVERAVRYGTAVDLRITAGELAGALDESPTPPTWTPAERDAMELLASLDEAARKPAIELLRAWPKLSQAQREALHTLATAR